MKVFISWKGEPSKSYAAALKEFLEGCFQSLNVFFSESDIYKGENWSTRLWKELDESDYCLICLTKDSYTSPWVNFEAGAIALKKARVSAVLFDLEPEVLKGPLSLFEATKLEEKDFLRLVTNINETEKVKSSVLEKAFRLFYGELIEKVRSIAVEKSLDTPLDTEKNIKEVLKITKECKDMLVRMEAIMPSIFEEVSEVSKADFQKKYNVLQDAIIGVAFDLANQPDDYYQNVGNRNVVAQVLVYLKKIISKDRLLKRRCENLIAKIEDKMSKCFYKVLKK